LAAITGEEDNKGWGQPDLIAMGVGCTAITALVTPTEIYVANAGDS
jgi:serine/threonine protein phosphatase PrpC